MKYENVTLKFDTPKLNLDTQLIVKVKKMLHKANYVNYGDHCHHVDNFVYISGDIRKQVTKEISFLHKAWLFSLKASVDDKSQDVRTQRTYVCVG